MLRRFSPTFVEPASASPRAVPALAGRGRHAALHRPRRGVTLLELLIVISMIVILTAISIPALRYALEDRKTREASRILDGYFAGAQARAAGINRPVGVWIERNANGANSAISLFMAEVPPPYTGDVENARAKITAVGAGPGGFGTAGTAEFDTSSLFLPTLVRNGDLIRFDYKGPYYVISNAPAAGAAAPFQLNFSHPSAPRPSTIGGQAITAYQIVRQPQRSSVGSQELPRNVVIDLTYSGLGASGIEFQAASATDTTPIVVLFSPTGRVDSVFAQNIAATPTNSIYFLIGKDDQLGSANLNDPASLWVTVGYRNGSVTSSENGVDPAGAPNTVDQARRFARRAQTMGGR